MNNLYKAEEYVIDSIKEEFNIDIENTKINDDELLDKINDFIIEILCDYEVYNNQLFDLAKELYFTGYNLLEKARDYDTDELLVVNDLLKDYIWDKILEYQERLGN